MNMFGNKDILSNFAQSEEKAVMKPFPGPA